MSMSRWLDYIYAELNKKVFSLFQCKHKLGFKFSIKLYILYPVSGVCKALFGETFSLGNGDGYESWKTDRPMRKEGFNIGKITKTF